MTFTVNKFCSESCSVQSQHSTHQPVGHNQHVNTKQRDHSIPWQLFYYSYRRLCKSILHSTDVLLCVLDLNLDRVLTIRFQKKKNPRCQSKMFYFVKGAVGGDEKWQYIQMYMAFKRYYSYHSNFPHMSSFHFPNANGWKILYFQNKKKTYQHSKPLGCWKEKKKTVTCKM